MRVKSRVRAHTLLKGWNQNELAEKTGLSKQTISHWCKPEVEVGDFKSLIAICSALGKDVGEVVSFDFGKRDAAMRGIGGDQN